jgi:putative ABC transport system substrate-binding protein
LSTAAPNTSSSIAGFDAFRKALNDLGYVEGRNLSIDPRWAEGNFQRASSLANELVALKPDVMVVSTTMGTTAARQATSTIPIVMMHVSDPVGAGFVTSLAHPGTNVTGITDYGIDLAGKSVELAHALLPTHRRIGVLMTDSALHRMQFGLIRDSAATIQLSTLALMANSLEEIETSFAAAEKEGIKVVIVLGGPPFSSSSMRSRHGTGPAHARQPSATCWPMFIATCSLVAENAGSPPAI